MKVATILLSSDNFYVNEDGFLPLRPSHDKALLTGLCEGEKVSELGYIMLPPSIQEVAHLTRSVDYVPITIKEIAEADLLIVSRSNDLIVRGKVFRLDKFKCILKDRRIELWKRLKK